MRPYFSIAESHYKPSHCRNPCQTPDRISPTLLLQFNFVPYAIDSQLFKILKYPKLFTNFRSLHMIFPLPVILCPMLFSWLVSHPSSQHKYYFLHGTFPDTQIRSLLLFCILAVLFASFIAFHIL